MCGVAAFPIKSPRLAKRTAKEPGAIDAHSQPLMGNREKKKEKRCLAKLKLLCEVLALQNKR